LQEARYMPACGGANLRSQPSVGGEVRDSLAIGVVVGVTGTVAGGSWSTTCPSAKTGTAWYVVTSVNGTPVSQRYGVDRLYAATGVLVRWSGTSRLVVSGPRTGNQVALTFDMGGRVGDAVAIVRYLVDHDVGASVFMTGAMADSTATDAARRVLAMIQAHPSLLTLGNHSYSHPDFRDLTATEMADQLWRTEVAIARTCSQDPTPFFRPPYGGYNSAVLAGVGAGGYALSIYWDIDTIDWRPINNPGGPAGPTADEIVAKVLAGARGGSIVLMHLGGYETYAALPRIVDGLRVAGFDLVSLDTMFGQ
jgi:peptidoglycan/xylan/chitin deacetylase (PgdA/CDA1 family)